MLLEDYDTVEAIIISRCLLGEVCRYDGKCRDYPAIESFIRNRPLHPVCPEVEAGFTVYSEEEIEMLS